VLFYPSTGSGHRFGTEDATGRMTALHNPLRAWASSEYYLNEAVQGVTGALNGGVF